MLEKLYNLGCLDYQRLVRCFSKELKLTSKTALVLMAILDDYKTDNNINSLRLSKIMNISDSDIDSSIVELLNLDYLQIQLVIKDGKSKETYRLTPFFRKCESLLNEMENEVLTSDIKIVSSKLEDNLKRTLSRSELDTISTWFYDGKTKDNILDAISKVKRTKNVFRIQSVNKILYSTSSSEIIETDPMIEEMFRKMGNH